MKYIIVIMFIMLLVDKWIIHKYAKLVDEFREYIEDTRPPQPKSKGK